MNYREFQEQKCQVNQNCISKKMCTDLTKKVRLGKGLKI